MRCQECDSRMELIFSGEGTLDVEIYWCYCGCIYMRYLNAPGEIYRDKWYIHTCYVEMD